MSAAPRRVLVVEDDSAQQLMYKRALKAMEFESVGVETAADARRALAGERFAVVILDLRLGGELSLDLFEEIRERHPEVSVVIATGHGSFDLARRSIQRDVVDFLSKPIPLGDLEKALDRAWSRHVFVQMPAAKIFQSRHAAQAEGGGQSGVTGWASLNIDQAERELIKEALRRTGDNRKAAAQLLGISERKLYYRLTQQRDA